MNDIDKELIRSRLKERRLFLGLSYQELSNKTGISKSSLQRYETGGIRSLPYDKVFKLSEALEVSTTYFTDLSTDYTGENDFDLTIPDETYRSDYLSNIKNFQTKALRNLTPTLITNGYSVEQHDRGKLGDLVAKKANEIWHIDFLYTGDINEASTINTGKQQLIFRLGRLSIYDKPITKYSIVVDNSAVAEQFLKFKPTHLNVEISIVILNEYGYEEVSF